METQIRRLEERYKLGWRITNHYYRDVRENVKTDGIDQEEYMKCGQLQRN